MTRTFLGLPTAPRGVGQLRGDAPFPVAARTALGDTQLRRNIGHATSTIRSKRAAVVAELPDWEELRRAGEAIKAATLANLPALLMQLEERVTAAGGTVHWARDAHEANAIVVSLVRAALKAEPRSGEGRAASSAAAQRNTAAEPRSGEGRAASSAAAQRNTAAEPRSGEGRAASSAAAQRSTADEVVKVKSMATQEIGLNEALERAGITAIETDLAELIVQLGGDRPSHILVPAIHRNRTEIRDIFRRAMPGVRPDLSDDPPHLAEAARTYLRQKFLSARVAISGANFAVAQTGTVVVVESEGNGRMCLTLPEVLITVMGIEKLVPTFTDLEVFLQLLPRSSTGERMNPYTSMWTGVTPGDGPREFHLVLLDNGRTAVLADEAGRPALHCIRCSACLNVCPVYERVGGHAYGSVYPGPIGAVLTPQLTGVRDNPSLPFASTLCGACFDACPVRIDIPSMLVHLRAQAAKGPSTERTVFAAVAWTLRSPRRWAAAQRLTRLGRMVGRRRDRIAWLPWPLSRWTAARDLPRPPRTSLRDWWARR